MKGKHALFIVVAVVFNQHRKFYWPVLPYFEATSSLYLVLMVPENRKRGKPTNVFYKATLILIPEPNKYTIRHKK